MNTKALKIIAAASSLVAIPVFANNVAAPEMQTHMAESFTELDQNKDKALDRSELTSVGFYGMTIDDVMTRYDVDNSQTLSESEYKGMQDYLTLKEQSYAKSKSINTAVEDTTATDEALSMDTQSPQTNSDVDLDISVQTAPATPPALPNNDDTVANNNISPLNNDAAPGEQVTPEVAPQADHQSDHVAELEWAEKDGMTAPAADTLTETTPQTGGAVESDITIAESVYSTDVSEIVGAEVHDDDGQRLGEVESILIDKQGMEAGVLIETDQDITLFTPVKYLRLENDKLVLIDGVTPNATYDTTRFRKIEPSANSINSALRRLELSQTY